MNESSPRASPAAAWHTPVLRKLNRHARALAGFAHTVVERDQRQPLLGGAHTSMRPDSISSSTPKAKRSRGSVSVRNHARATLASSTDSVIQAVAFGAQPVGDALLSGLELAMKRRGVFPKLICCFAFGVAHARSLAHTQFDAFGGFHVESRTNENGFYDTPHACAAWREYSLSPVARLCVNDALVPGADGGCGACRLSGAKTAFMHYCRIAKTLGTSHSSAYFRGDFT